MSSITFTNQPSLAELQQTYDVYAKALRLLVADGVKGAEIGVQLKQRQIAQLKNFKSEYMG